MDRGKRSARSVLSFYAKYSPSSFWDWKNRRNGLTRIVILSNFGSICRNLWDIFQSQGLKNIPQVPANWAKVAPFFGILAIFSSPGDSKLTPGGLGLMWNGRRKTFWTRSFELLDRNTTVLHFKTELVAETSLSASWFWLTSGGFPVTWGIFPVPWTLN